MNKIFLIIIFFIGNSIQAIEPVILNEAKGEYPLGKYLEILEDKTGKLTIDDIQNSELDKDWVKSNSEIPSFAFTKSAFWVRFKIRAEAIENFYLEIAYPHLDKIDFYQLHREGGITHKKAGDFLPFNERDIQYRNFSFSLTSKNNLETFYYIRFESESSLQFPIKIWYPINFIEHINREMIGMGLYFGVMLVMALYNLFIWLSVRDESYFYYVLYILIVSLFLANIYGITYQYLWFGSPSLYNTYFPTVFFLSNLAVLTFTSKFLQIKNNIPFLHNIFKALFIICTLGLISAFFVSYSLALKSNLVMSFLTVAFCLTVGVIMVKRKFRIGRYYLLAWSAFLIGGISLSMKTAGILPINFFTEHAFQFGSAFEVILLSLGLADRINDLKKKNEIAQEEVLANQKLAISNQILAIENLEKANKQKDEFLANTSHELRTPLNGIIGIAESLTDGVTGKLPIKTNENLSLIIASGKRLSNLINDILDFSKLKHHELQIHLQAVDIYSTTNLVIKLLDPLIKNKKLKLINQIPENIPAVLADENRLQQIFYNVIGNAIKFTVEGKVIISATAIDGKDKLVDTSDYPSDQETPKEEFIEITISDTGIGIPQENLESIFDSFEQVDSSSTRVYGGTGLGLSVTKQLVELQGGRIYAKSELGRGSEFIFTLPVTLEKPQNELDSNMEKIVSQVSENLEYLTDSNFQIGDSSDLNESQSEVNHILAVDDEPINLQVIANHFSFRGYRVTSVSNGKEALDFLETNEKPDLILLDVMMPMMTGFEVCLKIREKYDLNQLPILFLTAKNNSSDLMQGFSVQGNDYIVKPFSKVELLSRVLTHIKLKDYSENLEKKVYERTFQLNERMVEVEALKTQQDADYFLTSLLIEPLMANKSKSEYVKTSFFIEQKKKFLFRRKEYQLGGDICISGDISFKGMKHVFFFNGDAMGKSMQGAGGALVIGSVINSIITPISSKEKIINSLSPEEWLRQTFDEIQKVMESFEGTMLVSSVFGLINESSGSMVYFNADHPFPILFRDEKAVYLENELNSIKIGLPHFVNFSLNVFQLQNDDVIFIGSDGKDDIRINGAINEDSQLILKVIENCNSDMQKIYDTLRERGEITDDLSLVKIEYYE